MRHVDLNNDWKYSKTFRKEMISANYDEHAMETIRLPHSNVETPYNYFGEQLYQFISCYRRKLEVKEVWKDKQVLLTFEGIAHVACVYLNGVKVTTHTGGYTAFTVDIGPYLVYPSTGIKSSDDESVISDKSFENILVVEVDSRECNNLPPFGNVIDYMTYGGIYREVYLDIKEAVSIEDAFIITNVSKTDNSMTVNSMTNKSMTDKSMPDKSKTDKSVTDKSKTDKSVTDKSKTDKSIIDKPKTDKSMSVKLQVTLHGSIPDQEYKLKYFITDAAGQLIYSELMKASEPVILQEFTVTGVKEWEMEQPYLYYLNLQLFQDTENDIMLDEKTIRFGFRTCEFKEDGFYLNHKKVKLIGLNRHQSFPYVGYAMPKRMQERDAEILKQELQVNAVRTSHYPQSKHFINRCDELGLLVFTEIPGWQHIGDENWKAIALENVRDMVMQYRNHPSVILWGVRINESQDDDEFYTKTNKLAHDLDPSRQTGGVRYLKKSSLLEDVYTYNDFLHNGITKGLDRKEDVTSNRKAPYLVSEFNGHMFPTKTYDNEKHRLQHALRHARVLEAAFEQDCVCGAFGWCMFDYNTHQDFGSGDRICYHGVMDMYRNPKLAAAVYASQGEDTVVCEVSSSLDIGDHPAGNIGDVYVFTNADSIRLCKNGTFIKEFYPDRSNYPNLPHPPIVINDLVGNLLEKNESFSHRTAERIKKLLFAVKQYGPNHLPLKHKISMAFLMIKEHLKLEDAANLYYKYIGGWGGSVTTFRFESVKDGKIVKVINKMPSGQIRLEAITKTEILHEEETYDVAEVRIRAVDENGNLLPYYQEAISLETYGVVDLIGPKVVSLKGGMAGTYVKTTGRKGDCGLKIKQEDLGAIEIKFIIK